MEQIIFVITQAQVTSHHNKVKKVIQKGKRCVCCNGRQMCMNTGRLNNIIKPSNIKRKDNIVGIERTDITHQCLMTILDSPLNKTGRVRIFIHTVQNVLIEVNPAIRIPRTISRFNGLMVQLLSKHKIKAVTGEILMKIIKNPITLHLPPNTVKVELCKIRKKNCKDELQRNLTRGFIFFVNAIPSGEDRNCEFAELRMKVSDFGLSAAMCCCKVCNMFDDILNIF